MEGREGDVHRVLSSRWCLRRSSRVCHLKIGLRYGTRSPSHSIFTVHCPWPSIAAHRARRKLESRQRRTRKIKRSLYSDSWKFILKCPCSSSGARGRETTVSSSDRRPPHLRSPTRLFWSPLPIESQRIALQKVLGVGNRGLIHSFKGARRIGRRCVRTRRIFRG